MSKYPYIVIIRVFLCRKKMKGPGHIPGLYCVRQSNVTPFCENYAKLYFDAKHLEKGLNRGGGGECPFWPIPNAAQSWGNHWGQCPNHWGQWLFISFELERKVSWWLFEGLIQSKSLHAWAHVF